MKLQADAQKFQAQSQADQQAAAQKAQMDAQHKEREHQAKMAELQASLELQASNDQRDSERQAQKAMMDAQLDQQRLEFERYKADLTSQTQIYIAQLKEQPQTASGDTANQVMAAMQAMVEQLNAPKIIVRDESGRAIGVKPYQPETQK